VDTPPPTPPLNLGMPFRRQIFFKTVAHTFGGFSWMSSRQEEEEEEEEEEDEEEEEEEEEVEE